MEPSRQQRGRERFPSTGFDTRSYMDGLLTTIYAGCATSKKECGRRKTSEARGAVEPYAFKGTGKHNSRDGSYGNFLVTLSRVLGRNRLQSGGQFSAGSLYKNEPGLV